MICSWICLGSSLLIFPWGYQRLRILALAFLFLKILGDKANIFFTHDAYPSQHLDPHRHTCPDIGRVGSFYHTCHRPAFLLSLFSACISPFPCPFFQIICHSTHLCCICEGNTFHYHVFCFDSSNHSFFLFRDGFYDIYHFFGNMNQSLGMKNIFFSRILLVFGIHARNDQKIVNAFDDAYLIIGAVIGAIGAVSRMRNAYQGSFCEQIFCDHNTSLLNLKFWILTKNSLDAVFYFIQICGLFPHLSNSAQNLSFLLFHTQL